MIINAKFIFQIHNLPDVSSVRRVFDIQIRHYGRAFEFEHVCFKKFKCPGVAREEGHVEVLK